jgi:hypothetical protein
VLTGTTNQQVIISKLENALNDIIDNNKKEDLINVFGKDNISVSEKPTSIENIKNDLLTVFDNENINYTNFKTTIGKLKTNIENKNISSDIVILIGSTTSATGDVISNYNLSMRRSHSIVKYVMETLKPGTKDNWNFKDITSKEFAPGYEVFPIDVEYSLSKDLGFQGLDKSIIFRSINYGKNKNVDNVDCGKKIYNNLDTESITH